MKPGDIPLYMSVILIILQVFSDGNHRTGFKYLKDRSHLNYTEEEFKHFVKAFREQFSDHSYDHSGKANIDNFFLIDFVDSFRKYRTHTEKNLMKGGGKKNTSNT